VRATGRRSYPLPSREGCSCGSEGAGLLARGGWRSTFPGVRPSGGAGIDSPRSGLFRRRAPGLSQWRGRAGFSPASEWPPRVLCRGGKLGAMRGGDKPRVHRDGNGETNGGIPT